MKKETVPVKSKTPDTAIRDGRFGFMRSSVVSAKAKPRDARVPIFIQKDEDGFYVVECPLFEGCYSQAKTVDEALRNIREVIDLILEEKKNRDILKTYHPRELRVKNLRTRLATFGVGVKSGAG